MSKTSTAMSWPEPADDRLNVNHYQHPHDCRPPFEISQKARRILGLSIDGFHVNIPAVRLTTATPEHWPQQDSEVRKDDRLERLEIHIAKGPKQRHFVEGGGEDGAGEVENEVEIQQQVKIQNKKQAQSEFPARHYHGKASLDAKPSKRYYAQPKVAEGIRQGRASLDSVSRPIESSVSGPIIQEATTKTNDILATEEAFLENGAATAAADVCSYQCTPWESITGFGTAKSTYQDRTSINPTGIICNS
jgi:hypothetical protein